MLIIDTLLFMAGAYVVLGVLFGLYFVISGAHKIDEATKDAPWHFFLMIFPGVVLLWLPLTLKLFKK